MTVDKMVKKLYAYYRAETENICGGSLHIVTEDGNLGDSHVEFCIERAQECGDAEGWVLARALLAMTELEREKVYERWRGYGCPAEGV